MISNGFRILGNCEGERRLVNWPAAFAGYAACDARARTDCEGYLSAFTFGTEFREHLERTGSVKGYLGPCGAIWLWLDIDRDGDLDAATRDARSLAAHVVDRYALDGDELLTFLSGGKGYHIGLPTTLWSAVPSPLFHKCARQFASTLAKQAKATIDDSVFDRVRPFRAPNSRHAKTRLHKRRLEYGELLHLSTAAIVERAREPEPFDIPEPPSACQVAIDDWRQAAESVERQAAAMEERRGALAGATLNRLTLDFIRDGAPVTSRHRRLFSAAANLSEFGCPPALAHALLTEAALDCGLPPKDVHRQIECGLAGVQRAGSDAA